MQIPGSPPSGVPNPHQKKDETSGKDEGFSPKTRRKVATTPPKASGINGENPESKDGTPVENRSVAITSEDNALTKNLTLPALKSDIANETAPDGTILIEAGDDPEAAASKAIEDIRKEHGEDTANKAKALFKGVLDFCSKHKGKILTVVGFGCVIGGIAGGIACPVVFVLAAPGIMMLGCGLSELISDADIPAVPGNNNPPSPEHKTEGNEPDPSEIKPKKGEKGDDHTKKTVDAETSTEDKETTTSDIPTPPPVPQQGDYGYEDYLAAKALRKKLENQEVSAHFLPTKPGTVAYKEMLHCLKNDTKSAAGSQLKEEDFKEADVEKLLEENGFSEDQHKRIYAEYSKVAVGFDFFLWVKGNSQTKDGQKVYPSVSEIKPQELLALRRAMKKEALNAAIQMAKNKEKIDSAKISGEAVKNLEALTARLTAPSAERAEISNKKNEAFYKGVNTFLGDFATSFKVKTQ